MAHDGRWRGLVGRMVEPVSVVSMSRGADSTEVVAGVDRIGEASPVENIREYPYNESRVASRICLVGDGG